MGKTAVYFKEKVEELSDGTITIDIQAAAFLVMRELFSIP